MAIIIEFHTDDLMMSSKKCVIDQEIRNKFCCPSSTVITVIFHAIIMKYRHEELGVISQWVSNSRSDCDRERSHKEIRGRWLITIICYSSILHEGEGRFKNSKWNNYLIYHLPNYVSITIQWNLKRFCFILYPYWWDEASMKNFHSKFKDLIQSTVRKKGNLIHRWSFAKLYHLWFYSHTVVNPWTAKCTRKVLWCSQ